MALGWNPWPKEFPLFKETINEYTSAMLQAGERVMRAIALSLNLPLNYFQSTFNDSFWVKQYSFIEIILSFVFFVIRLFDVFVILLFLLMKVNHLNMVMVVVNIRIMVG